MELKKRLSLLQKNTPQIMKELDNWCVFKTKWNEEKGKKDKYIISPINGRWAKINDSSTWTDFKTALKYAEENNCEGLSFALNGNAITCIDLDKCYKNGKLNSLSSEMLGYFSNTYVEQSASGNGIHIFFLGDVLENGTYKNRNESERGEIEVYDSSRFISMTGKTITSTNELEICSNSAKEILQKTLGKKTQNKVFAPSRNNQSDAEVIAKIRNSKVANDFNNLMAGISLTGDHSRDDFKLLNILAFFTDCDKWQMESIFATSALYRPEKKAYLQRSIENACSTLVKRQNYKEEQDKSRLVKPRNITKDR